MSAFLALAAVDRQSDPSTTDWITALATSFLGALGVIIGLWQWHAGGFRPRYKAQIDTARTGISLQAVNKGRALGIVLAVHVASPMKRTSFMKRRSFLFEEGIVFNGFPSGQVQAFALPGLTAARLILVAQESLSTNAVIRVQAGTKPGKTIKLRKLKDERIRFEGLNSLLPPGTSFNHELTAEPPAGIVKRSRRPYRLRILKKR